VEIGERGNPHDGTGHSRFSYKICSIAPCRPMASNCTTAQLAPFQNRSIELAQNMAPLPADSAAFDSATILIVEDDPETRRLYTTILTEGGFSIEEAHNGFQAYDKAIASPPDLIVADIAVPGLDGIELCRRLRERTETRLVPVLAVTGYSDRSYSARALQAGATHVLFKPVDAALLLSEARRLLAV